jgi:hypothetical protein
VCARRKVLLEQAKKVTTGVRSHKQERKRGGPIADAPDLCGAFERRAMCGLGIPTGGCIEDREVGEVVGEVYVVEICVEMIEDDDEE